MLYYEQLPGLGDRIFIKPQWLVDVMKELVRHDLPQLVAQLADGAAAETLLLLPAVVTEADTLRLHGEATEFVQTGVATEYKKFLFLVKYGKTYFFGFSGRPGRPENHKTLIVDN